METSCGMVGVTKKVKEKEDESMAEYYLKVDNIMKNMFVAALKDEIQAQHEQERQT